MDENNTDKSIFHRFFFMGFSVNTDIEFAKKKFKEKHKYEPDMCEISNGVLWVGPIKNFRKGENI